MQVALVCDDAGNPIRRRALAQIMLRSGLSPEGIRGAGGGTTCSLVWTREPTSGIALHIPQCLDPHDRPAWRAATGTFLTEWNRARLRPEWLFARVGDRSTASHDLPLIALGLLDQWDESLSDAVDEHGRFPAHESQLGAVGLLELPIVDRIARAIGTELARLGGSSLPKAAPDWGLAITFDIDSEGMYRGANAYRTALAAMRSGPLAMARFAGRGVLVSSRILPDPHLDLRSLCQVIEGLDARATFFVQTHRAHPLDSYELRAASPLVPELRRAVREGHEVGLHSSYATGDDSPDFDSQQRLLRERIRGVRGLHRAHYLRGTLDASWRSKSIIESSLAYGSKTGFRLGTSVPFALQEGAIEAPPAAMDITLRRDDALGPRGAARKVLRLAREVRSSGGVLTVIWHPHNIEPVLWPGWLASMVEVVTEVRHAGGRVGPLGAMVKPWRDRARDIDTRMNEVFPS